MLFLPGPDPEQVAWALCPGETMAEAMDAAQPTSEVWPDNAQAVDVFVKSMGQWRVGFGGPYALDYNVFPIVAPRAFNSPEWPDIFDEIRVMEQAALETMNAQNAKKGKR